MAGPSWGRGWGDPWVLSRPCPLAHRPPVVMGCSRLRGRASGATCPEEPRLLCCCLGGLQAASWNHIPTPRDPGEGHVADRVGSQGRAARSLQAWCALPISQCIFPLPTQTRQPGAPGPPTAMPWVSLLHPAPMSWHTGAAVLAPLACLLRELTHAHTRSGDVPEKSPPLSGAMPAPSPPAGDPALAAGAVQPSSAA